VHCREAVRLRPSFPEALNNLGNALRELGRLDEARAAYAAALGLDPTLAMTINNMGQALQEEGKPGEALAWYEEAIARAPAAARFHTHRASALAELERHDEAAAGYQTALAHDPSAIEACCGLGRLRDEQGRHAEALELLRTAVGRRPDSASARVQLASLLAEVGEFAAAEASLREALRRDPRHVAALTALAELKQERLPDADLEAMCDLLTEREQSPGTAAALHFGLARVLDARGEFPLAAENFILGNALRCKAMSLRGEVYRPELQQGFVDSVIAAHTPGFFDRVRGFGLESRRPVFIFGLPRSGTTLVEQILASHARVCGGGELKLVRDALRALPRVMGRDEDPLACLPDLDPPSTRTLAQGYLDGLDALDTQADRVTDKMPENFQSLGLIAALFPNATLIHCRRDLRDVALSCWTTNFRNLGWTFDRDAIAHYFGQYTRLMEHWRRVLPAAWLDVDYEALVADLEGESRRIVAWCGLDWDPNCLAFHETRRPVRTASSGQVRRPLYSHSIGRWRNYAAELGRWFERFSS
jgi:tetratricopeptide (TPR) repeat protein